MTITQAIRAANDPRPISYRERQEATQVLRDAINGAREFGYHVLANARQAHLAKLMESKP